MDVRLNTADGNSRDGISLVELLIAIGILGLLMSLLLPAVQQSRAAARRTQCANNLRQIGAGLQQHAEAHGFYPTEQDTFIELLPYLDQAALYKKWKDLTVRPPIVVPWISCPEDGYVDTSLAIPSYVVNDGSRLRTGYIERGLNGFRTGQLGLGRRVHPRDVTDGLSQTAALSEHLVQPVGVRRAGEMDTGYPLRFLWYTERRFSQPGQEALAVDECRYHRTTRFPSFFTVNGGAALVNGIPGYDHMLPPNHEGCHNGPEDLEMSSDYALIPPTSLHVGGVNVLLGDGSVHFVSSEIDPAPWHALGTRAGHEVASFP